MNHKELSYLDSSIFLEHMKRAMHECHAVYGEEGYNSSHSAKSTNDSEINEMQELNISTHTSQESNSDSNDIISKE